jgi:tetratricopeptide (TPR) repeat protein
MNRTRFRPSWRLLALSGLLLAGAASARPAEDPVRQKVLALNRLTGSETLNARYRALQDDPAAVKQLLATARELAQEKQPLSFNASLLLGQLAADQKDLKTGEMFFRLCVKQASKLLSPSKLAEAYDGLIEMFYENKKYAASADVCQELLELNLNDGKKRIILKDAVVEGEEDFIIDVKQDFTKSIRPAVRRRLIQAITKQGKYEQALKQADNLIKSNDHWLFRQLKGWVYNEAGKYAEAAKVYEDLLERIRDDKELDEDEREIYLERYRYALSGVYVDLKQIDKAADTLKELMAKNPDEPGYYNDLGYIWADHDQNLAEAEKLIRKALELDRKRRQAAKPKPAVDRENGMFLDSLGWVLFKQKRLKEAKAALLKAVEDPNSQHIDIYDHLAEVHMALGERDEAIAAWRRALSVAGEGRREQQRKAAVEKKLEKNQ